MENQQQRSSESSTQSTQTIQSIQRVRDIPRVAKLTRKKKSVFCETCQKTFSRHQSLLEHYETKTHQEQVLQRAQNDIVMAEANESHSWGGGSLAGGDSPVGGNGRSLAGDSLAGDSLAGGDVSGGSLAGGDVSGGGDSGNGQPAQDGDDLLSGDEESFDSCSEDEDDMADLNAPFIHRFRHIVERDVDMETINQSAQQDFNNMETGLIDASPFPSLQFMLLLAFICGDDDPVSRRMMQKVMYLIVLMVKIYEKSRETGVDFKLPALDALFKYQERKKNVIPVMEPKEVQVLEPTSRSYHLNLPSMYLELLVRNPLRCESISALPDYTSNEMVSLQQGHKWRTDPLFQQPVLTVSGIDYWVGDIISVGNGNSLKYYLLDSFFSKAGETLARCYEVLFLNVGKCLKCLVNAATCDLAPSSFNQVISKSLLLIDNCHSLAPEIITLTNHHKELLFGRNKFKIDKPNGAGGYYKVKITPVILFTDDTSGNISKQFNKFDSWSMVCAALPFEKRNQRENTFFLGAVAGSNGLSAMDVVPELVDDLKALEQGVVMYSAEHGEDVLVVAPVLFITADNPRHSELVGLLGLTTTFPCRFCYYRKIVGKKPGDYVELLNKLYPRRTRDHYCLAATTLDRKTPISGVLETPLMAKDFSYKNKGADDLLQLQSFDPSNDTPVEILHTVLLGVAKYLVTHMVKVILKNQGTKLERLTESLERYGGGPGFSRSFRRNLRHCGSFLGRDFKQLIQVLPLIIKKEFIKDDDTDMRILNRSFIKLGILSSLVFVRNVPGNIEDYIARVDLAVKELTIELDNFDIVFSDDHTPFSLKPKVHMLHHLPANIARFGPPLHYETEKGEQFNKFIREHIVNTNRHNVSRDIARLFGKQATLRHVLEGGSWNGINGITRCSKDVIDFISEEGDDFFKIMFGAARDYQDNNEVNVSMVDKRWGIFARKGTNTHFIGKTIMDGSSFTIIEYRQTGKDEDGNPLVKTEGTFHSHNDLIVVGVLDVDTKEEEDHHYCVVNQYKFGSYWLLNTML